MALVMARADWSWAICNPFDATVTSWTTMEYIVGGLVVTDGKYQLTDMFVDVAATWKTTGPTGLAENLKKLQMLGTANCRGWNHVEKLQVCYVSSSVTTETAT